MDTNNDPNDAHRPRTAIVTGGSRGLGAALARSLVERGWRVVIDGRDGPRLAATGGELGPGAICIQGDVTDPAHRRRLVDSAAATGRLDLLVNNASELGPSPLPSLADLPIPDFERLLAVNVVAPLALIQLSLPLLGRSDGAIVDVTSDASVEVYSGWGGYGSSKAALDHLGAVLAAETEAAGTDVRVWTVDPGDMRTDMHQAAFPGEDISDRPEPEAVAPLIAALAEARPPSGRVRAADLAGAAR